MNNPAQSQKGRLGALVRQFGKFIIVGVINTGIDFLVLNVEMKITGITSGGAIFVLNAISFSVATVNSYFLNKFWTFQDKDGAHETAKFSQFMAVSVVGVVINSSIVYLVTSFLSPFLGIGAILAFLSGKNINQFWANFAKLAATGISLIWNFIGYKLWVFKK
jgi:putative flippase GtrA